MTIKHGGYALIEILVVIAIIVLFSALSVGYYRDFDERRKLDSEVKQFVDILDLAANKSNSGDLSPNPICADFQGYSVRINSATSYDFRFNCGGVYTTLQSYTMKPGITLSRVGRNILFKPLTNGTNLVNSLTIRITNGTINKCTNVQISPQGIAAELPTCRP